MPHPGTSGTFLKDQPCNQGYICLSLPDTADTADFAIAEAKMPAVRHLHADLQNCSVSVMLPDTAVRAVLPVAAALEAIVPAVAAVVARVVLPAAVAVRAVSLVAVQAMLPVAAVPEAVMPAGLPMHPLLRLP